MIKLEVIGVRELQNLLAELPKRVGSKGSRAAVTKGSIPILRAAKPAAPRESGLLRKAIGRKIKTYQHPRGTTAVAIIGARWAIQGTYKGKKRIPAKYLHLVEGGTKHSAANPFLKRAFEANKAAAVRIAGEKFKEVVEREARKLGKLR